MTTVGPISGASALTPTGPAQTADATSKDFNMFLRLMTTQMKNQDPLDPMKSSEYTQQLAQYSQVEQSVQQTSTLKNILSRMSTQDMSSAANYIGKEATFDGAISNIDNAGGSASWTYTVSRPVTSISATISDANGKVVQQLTLNPNSTSGRVVWDGQMVGGSRASGGPYSLTITATDGNGNAVPVNVSATGIVKSVQMQSGQVVLGLGNGSSLPISSLIAVSASG
jgi:flagellar basal-body rod modification protein FlgD